MRETHHEREIGKQEERILQQPKLSLYPIVINLYKGDLIGLKVPLHQNLLFVFDCYLIQYQPLSNPLGLSSSTNSLQIYCIGLIGLRSHISWAWLPKTCPYRKDLDKIHVATTILARLYPYTTIAFTFFSTATTTTVISIIYIYIYIYIKPKPQLAPQFFTSA